MAARRIPVRGGGDAREAPHAAAGGVRREQPVRTQHGGAGPRKPAPRRPARQWAPGAVTLADAARAVATVVARGRTADDALAPFEERPERAAIRAIALGTLRWFLRLAPAVERLVAKPAALVPEIRALLVASAHQVEYSRGAPEVSVHLAVDAARALGHERAAGLVNAVLRRFVAGRAALLAEVDADRAARYAHPAWLVEAIDAAWPEQADALLAANNAHPPMVLRVNLARQSVADCLASLAAAGLAARALPWSDTAVQLEHPVAVSAIPGFREGRVSVQDAGAQLAAPWLGAEPGMRVLDACAAPGGKTCHILERTPGLAALVALDSDAQRLRRVRENLDRIGPDLGQKATLVAADLRDTGAWWDGHPFDRILLDAPCSSTGVIRRHPDIKLLRRATDIPSFAGLQRELLATAFRLLVPGGRLLYCTCSVLPAENQGVTAAFLAAEPTARLVRQASLLPGAEAGTDGFHYACIEKTTAVA